MSLSVSSQRNWVQAVRRATPWAQAWNVADERRLYGRAQLPNEKLRAAYDAYKKSNFGNAPSLFTGLVGGRDIYIFSLGHGLGSPATVFIHDRAGHRINSM